MPNYKNAKIYTIRSPNTDLFYIGSTIQPLYKRFDTHKRKYKNYINNTGHNITSFELLKYNNAYIELFEKYPCNDKIELNKREGELIRLYNDKCVNRCIAGRTKNEYYNDNKEKINSYKKEWYNDNKNRILKKRKEDYNNKKSEL